MSQGARLSTVRGSDEEERVAICVESGVEERRAVRIARCETARDLAREHGLEWRCVCGGHRGA